MNDLLADCRFLRLEEFELNDEFYSYVFHERDFEHEFRIAPFRPEFYGGIFYGLMFFIGEKYGIKIVHYGEANLLPFYAMNAHECRIMSYTDSKILKEYDFERHNIMREYTIMENIQRKCTQIIGQVKDIKFGYRMFFERHVYDLMFLIHKITGMEVRDVYNSIDYNEAYHYCLHKWDNCKPVLWERSQSIYEMLRPKHPGKFWFASHARHEFIEFENYFYEQHPDLVIKDSLIEYRYPIYKDIVLQDADCVLSTQILFSLHGVKFITSGGSTTLFYHMPFVELAHASFWDNWIREMYEVKDRFQLKYFGSTPIRFNAGGLMNNKNDYEIKNYPSYDDPEELPPCVKEVEYRGEDVLLYAGEVFRCIVERKEHIVQQITSQF